MLTKANIGLLSIISVLLAGNVHAQEVEIGNGVPDYSASQESAYLFSASTRVNKARMRSDPMMSSLKEDNSVMSIESIGMNARLLNGSVDQFFINLGPGLVYPVKQLEAYAMDDEYTAWSGEIDMGVSFAEKSDEEKSANQALFVRSKGDRIYGQIQLGHQTFELLTMNNGEYVLVERDYSQLNHGDDTPETDYTAYGQFPFDYSLSEAGPAGSPGPRGGNTQIRVIQAVTPQVVNALGGISAAVDLMHFFIAQTNQVYRNNNLALRLVNAGTFRVSPNERSTVGANLSDLVDTDDVFLDNYATNRRNERSADLVALIVNANNLCGQAAGIGVTQSRGYFVVNRRCRNFTFAHEIGHLFGARHDTDTNRSPFSYGHGFLSTRGNFRTVMAVNGAGRPPRIGLFSTDRSSEAIAGVTPGNRTFRDNERVHQTRASTVARFR
ncbi:MAG: zinc-dependent metalloprotease [Xanthomonadales bacterium]|nr:zinc-dependent metalloprotease [Xanthomonadales bacterium]